MAYPRIILHEPGRHLSAEETASHVSNYLSEASKLPYLHPDAIFTSDGLQFGTHGGNAGGLALHQLRRVEKGLRGEKIAAEVDQLQSNGGVENDGGRLESDKHNFAENGNTATYGLRGADSSIFDSRPEEQYLSESLGRVSKREPEDRPSKKQRIAEKKARDELKGKELGSSTTQFEQNIDDSPRNYIYNTRLASTDNAMPDIHGGTMSSISKEHRKQLKKERKKHLKQEKAARLRNIRAV